MEGPILLLILLLLYLIVAPAVALKNARSARSAVEKLEAYLRKLQAVTKEREDELQRRLNRLETMPGQPVDAVPIVEEAPVRHREPAAPPVDYVQQAMEWEHRLASPGPPAVSPPTDKPAEPRVLQPVTEPPASPAGPPRSPLPAKCFPQTSGTVTTPAVKTVSVDSLERFMGVKLFAWVGGLALFLGLVFFVKLSIERGWISPELRTAIGFVAGMGLLGAGLKFNAKPAYAVLGQTLCATGTVVLYGMTFAAHAYYRFPVFANPLTAFALMALITTTAFLLAVRMKAQVVAVLGMIGGFLTPVLCSTGQDNPLGLFGYIALLDLGVLAVAKYRRWQYLTVLAAGGTILMQIGWFSTFFHAEGYADGAKTWVPVAVFTGFAGLFSAAAWLSSKLRDDDDIFPDGSAMALCGSAMFAAFVFLGCGSITARPALLYGFVLLINLTVMASAWKRPLLSPAPVLAGLLTFAHLAAWTTQRLSQEMLPSALAIYLVFGLLHTAYGVLWQKRQTVRLKIDAAWVPVVTLVLLFVPVMHFHTVSLMVWPAILLVDLAIIGLAMLSRSLLPVFTALILTLLTALCWLFKLPAAGSGSLTMFLCVLGGFAIVFAVASSLLARRMREAGDSAAGQNELARWLPVCSAVLPFALLILAMLQLQVTNPSPVFGLALLLSLFLLGLGRIGRLTALPLAALLCVLALETVWHGRSFDPDHPWLPLAWYLGFYALFAVHPHMFRKQLAETTTPWAAAAIAALGTFALVYRLITESWPNEMMGLVPAAFAGPVLVSLIAVLRLHSAENPARLSQLAWFGGVALFFITLIFPLQFKEQWLTVAWAFEGAALCWLFRRVPHPGLRPIGAALLAVSFARLVFNPFVLSYQIRGDVPILNWQLYSYGLTAAAMFLAARWLAPPRHLIGRVNIRGLFTILGGVLLFVLLNLEIADAFTEPGSRSIALEFSGNFARDMTYSIAWGLFALTLLVIGLARRSPETRYAGIGLLAVTLLKLFLHDLKNIESGYRIGALIAVALIALTASFLYQRFPGRSESVSKP